MEISFISSFLELEQPQERENFIATTVVDLIIVPS
jgi:hypothetical protein